MTVYNSRLIAVTFLIKSTIILAVIVAVTFRGGTKEESPL